MLKNYLPVITCLCCFAFANVNAQFSENFNDGDFTNSPVWVGNTADWTVNSSFQLQSTSAGTAPSFYLSTANTLATGAEWYIYVKLGFNPSSQNFVDIYLTASDSILTASATTGYFVHLGGTADDISLFRKDATGDTTRLINGADAVLNASSNEIRLHVIRDASNQWSLYRDISSGGTSPVLEGVSADATYTTSAFFGIMVKGTAGNLQKHFFDDISVQPYVPDVTAPVVQSATVIGLNGLDVLFNEPVDATTAAATANYIVDNGVGSPATAVRDAANAALVHLTFPANFPSGNFIVTINGVQDIAGNAVVNGTASFSYTADVTPPALQLVTPLSATSLDVLFNEPVETVSAEQVANYSVDNGIGNPASAQVDASNAALVHLLFATPFANGITNTLTVTNVADLSGNVLVNATATFSYSVPQQFDVVIDEIMADPTPQVSLPNAEFVEIKNTSGNSINLQGWRISSLSTTSAPFGSSYVLPADSFVILTSTGSAALFTSYRNVLGVTSFPSIDNTSTTLSLISKEGNIIHSVSYNDSWYQNDVKKEGGWTLEMIDTHNPCGGAENWKASVDPRGGTPAEKNSVDGNNPDQTAPVLLRAAPTDSVNVILTFSETVDNTRASNPSNYSVSNVISVLSAIPLPPSYSKVQLVLASALGHGVIYTVTVNGLADCSGNVVQANTAKFGLASPIDSFDIIINEVLFNPKSPNTTDYVEIYNRSQKIVDLKNLYIANTSDLAQITTDNILMFPGEFYVLSKSGAMVKQNYVALNPDNFIDIPTLPSFSDASGTVILRTAQGIIDSLSYDDSWHFALLDNEDGISLERVDYNKPTQDKENWHSAASTVGFGTPSYKNSQFRSDVTVPGDVTIVPKVFSPDNDGFEDFTFINYQLSDPEYVANITIYDAAGRPVKALAKNATLSLKGTFRWDGLNDKQLKVPVGTYIIYTEVFNLSGKKKTFKNTVVVAARF